MIAHLNGILSEKEPAQAVIDVQGVGYLLKISLQTSAALPPVGEKCKLFCLQIIREDAHTLYGFATREERVLFEHLISVSGIGPAIALVFLSSMTGPEIVQAIVTEDVKTIQGIKGIGLKTAQRAVIELKDKLKKEPLATTGTLPARIRMEALAALVTLGIPKTTAEKSVDNILKRAPADITLEEVIKLSLR
jgi:Holliday junction DNA helicase RuvA